jgi:hypothetical protein
LKLLDPRGSGGIYQTYQFNTPLGGHTFNFGILYPPASFQGTIYLVVQPILISQPGLDTLVEGTAFQGAQLVPYQGTGTPQDFGVLFRVTCEDASHSPVSCPPPGGVYKVKTSWDIALDTSVTNPAYLKAPEGTKNWENIFTDYSATRFDPTGVGRTCCRVSDFVFVQSVTQATGLQTPTVNITTPPDGAVYTVNQVVSADYSCNDPSHVVSSCLGTVPKGYPINTWSVGTKTFQVNATVFSGPAVGHVVTYYVRGFSPYLLYDPGIPVKSGWPLLIMLELHDAKGKDVSSPKTKLKAVSILPTSPNAGGTPWGFARSCKDFLYLPWPGTKGRYAYILDTRGLKAGTYLLKFSVSADSGSSYAAPFTIK